MLNTTLVSPGTTCGPPDGGYNTFDEGPGDDEEATVGTGEGAAGEPGAEDQTDSLEVWEIVQTLLPDRREQRLVYLLYHCGLKPREIVQFCAPEWSDVREIYRLRCNILHRLRRNADQLRWRLSYEGRS